MPYELLSRAEDNPWVTPSGVGGPRPARPGPPAPLAIAPPVGVERLPALLPAKSPRNPAPPVAALLAVRGAQVESPTTEDDLRALADKIKRILDDQARRHGISV